MVKFNQKVTTKHNNVKFDTITTISRKDYTPDGLTALYDAIGYTITKRRDDLEKDDRFVVCTILTDGQENSSNKFNQRDVFNLIEEMKATGKWTFRFLATDQDAFESGSKLGIKNCVNFVSTNNGLESLTQKMNSAFKVCSLNNLSGTSVSNENLFDNQQSHNNQQQQQVQQQSSHDNQQQQEVQQHEGNTDCMIV